MTAAAFLTPTFVEFVPAVLEDGVMYISIEYKTSSHLCACGCGRRVVTPLSPLDWSLEYDGESVSLNPSIGNWDFACQSHYIVHRGAIHWAAAWSQDQIERGRRRDLAAKLGLDASEATATVDGPAPRPGASTWRRRLAELVRSWR
ncbi:MAG TPA: DUF6527 family protein [Microthrixaceae bacterium]|nr:DUF6527 family protein [Microthrixaceae bacterium]